MAANIWGELIKQGFENFRSGLNNLSQGTASVAQGANNGIQPFQGQQANNMMNLPNLGNNNGLMSIADTVNDMKQNGVFKTQENPQLNNSLGSEIQQQTKPTFNPNFSGNTSSLGQAISNQAPSLFDRIKGF